VSKSTSADETKPKKKKKKRTATAKAAKRLTKIAKKGAKTAKATAQFVATTSAGKAKDAAQFVYKHRQKIMDAVELLTAVLGTASLVLGKPEKSKRRRKRSPSKS
jgi:hypothetical protein